MTFKFKTLSELEENLRFTKSLMLAANSLGEGEIDKLHEPRRSEILYLEAVLKNIQEHMKKPKLTPAQLQNLPAVYYGAVLTVLLDSGDLEGKLASNLATGIGLDKKTPLANQPSLIVQAKCHTLLNAYLQAQLFKDGDLRNQITKGHPLTGLDTLVQDKPTEHMNRLVLLGYQLECKAQQAVINSLPSNQRADSLKFYEPKRKTPASAIINTTWPLLKAALTETIIAELASKPKKSLLGITLSPGVSTIEALGQPRSSQLNYLRAVEALLDNSSLKEGEKIAILTGAMHFICKQIDEEYTVKANLKNSVVYTHLAKILNLQSIELPDRETLLEAANQFTRAMTIYSPKPEEEEKGAKKAFLTNNPFKDIDGLDMKAILCMFQESIMDCRETIFKQKSHIHKTILITAPSGEKPQSSWMPSFSGLSQWGMFGSNGAEESVVANAASAASAPKPE